MWQDIGEGLDVSYPPLLIELRKLSEEFYSSLPHKHEHRSVLINNKRLIAQKQDLCQVRSTCTWRNGDVMR